MQIEMLKVEEIKSYQNNPRDNSGAVDAVAKSIKEFGFKVPIIVDKDNILVAGHTRILAAKKIGLEAVPAIRADDLSDDQIRAFRVADNKLHELSTWNYELLPVELAQLQEANFDLELLGFDSDELAKILDPGIKDGLTDPDDVPEPPAEPITKPGDLWILGDHRLLCGDSTNREDVSRLMAGTKSDMIFTDAPYNVCQMYLVCA